MNRISIPIKNSTVGISKTALLVSVVSALTLGIFVGSFFVSGISLPIPSNKESTLGAVGEAVIDTRTQGPTLLPEPDVILSPSQVTGTPGITQAASEPAPQSVSIDSLELSVRKFALENTIKEKALAIERATQRIEQLKGESVSLITEFNFNCGDWAGDCAPLFKSALEKNNEEYEQMLATRETLYEELANTERLLIASE